MKRYLEKRAVRVTLTCLAWGAAVLLVVVALGPVLLAKTIGPSLVRDAVQEQVSGRVGVAGLSLGWFGNQSVEGLSIVGDDANAVFVDAEVSGGLLYLWWTGFKDIKAKVKGRANSTLDANSQLVLVRTLTKDAGGGVAQKQRSSSPSKLPEGLSASLELSGIRLSVRDVPRGGSYVVDDLHGDIHLTQKDGRLTVALAGESSSYGRKGSLEVRAAVGGLAGEISVQRLGVSLAIRSASLRAPVGDRFAELESLDLELAARSLSEPISVKAKGAGAIVDARALSVPGRSAPPVRTALEADLKLGRLFDGAGRFAFSPASVSGGLTASNIPISLIAPFGGLSSSDPGAANPIEQFIGKASEVIERCSIECAGRGGEGAKAEAPSTADLHVVLAAPKAKVDLRATVEGAKTIREGALDATFSLDAATLASLTGSTFERGAELRLTGDHLAWSDPGEHGRQSDAVSGSLRLEAGDDIQPRFEVVSAAGAARALAVLVSKGSNVVVELPGKGEPIAATLALRVGYALGDAAPKSPEQVNVSGRLELLRDLSRVEAREAAVSLPVSDEALATAFDIGASGGSAAISLSIPSWSLPLDGKSFEESLLGSAGEIELRLDGRFALPLAGGPRPLGVDGAELHLVSSGLSTGATVTVATVIDGAQARLEGTLLGLSSPLAALDPLALLDHATLTATDPRLAATGSWVPQAGEWGRRLDVPDARLVVNVERNADDPRRARIEARLSAGDTLAMELKGASGLESARVEALTVSALADRRLMDGVAASGAGGAPIGIELAGPCRLSLASSSPIDLVFSEVAAGKLPVGGLTLTAEDISFARVPGLSGPVGVRGLSLAFNAAPDASAVFVKGGCAAVGKAANDRLNSISVDLRWSPKGRPDSLLHGLEGSVLAEGIAVGWIERLFGLPESRIAIWTGGAGSVRAELAASEGGDVVRVHPSFPQVRGAVELLARGAAVDVNLADLAVTVPAAELSALQARSAGSAGGSCEFTGDLGLRVSAGHVRLPHLREANAGALSRAAVELDLRTDSINVRVPTRDGQRETLGVPPLRLVVDAPDVGDRIGFRLAADGSAGGAAAGARIAASGEIEALLDAQGRLAPDSASVNCNVDVHDLPTSLVELFAGTGGSLARKVGEKLTINANAAASSRGARSTVSANLVSEYLDLKIPDVAIERGTLRLAGQDPVQATFALSPGIKEDLLYAINPLFGDISLDNKRAAFRLTSLNCPLDGDLSKLDAEFALEVGDVKLSGDKPICILFALVKGGFSPGAEARVEPFVATIRNGKLVYKNFGLKLFRGKPGGEEEWKVAVNMEGDVRLGEKPMRVEGISASIPLTVFVDAAGQATRLIADIGGLDGEIAQKVSVGVTMYGELHDAKGRPKELKQKITVPGAEQILSPENLLKWGIKEGAARGLGGMIPKP